MVSDNIYISPELLEVLKINTTMSESTWRKIIAADPDGWREMLEERQEDDSALEVLE